MDENENPQDPYARFMAGMGNRMGAAAPSTPTPADPPAQKKGPGKIGKLWRAVVRGSAEAVNETADTVVDVGKVITKKTGLYKAVNNEEDEAAWLDWYEADEDVTLIPRKYLPKKSEGGYAFAEGAVKFGVGMVGFSKVLKPIKALSMGGGVARAAVAGAAADFSVFDPHEERLSNFVESGPEWMSNPVTRYLQADEDDGILEGRAKNLLEGMMTGVAVDRVIAGVKMLKVARKAKAGKITAEAAEEQIDAITKEADNAARPDEPVKVVHEGDAGATVTLTKEDADKLGVTAAGEAAEDGTVAIKVADPARAERIAASLNYAVKNRRLPKGAEVTPELVAAVRKEAENILNGNPTHEGWEGFGGGLDQNLNFIDETADVAAQHEAVSSVFREEFQQVANRTREGLGQSNAVTNKRADNIVKYLGEDEALREVAHLAARNSNLAAELVAHRKIRAAFAKNVRDMGRMLDLDPSNPAAADNMRRAIQKLHDYSLFLTESVANTARALQSQNIKVGDGALPGAAGKSAKQNLIDGIPGDIRESANEAVEELRKARAEYEKAVKQLEAEKTRVKTERKAGERAAKTAKDNPDAITKGTELVKASEFSLARAHRKAQAIIDKANYVRENGVPSYTDEVLAEARQARSERILTDAYNPVKATEEDEALAGLLKGGRNAIEDISKVLDEQDRFLDDLAKPAREARAKVEKEEATKVINKLFKDHRAATKIKGMTKGELRAMARLLTYSGDPDAIMKALRGTMKALDEKAAGNPSWRNRLVGLRANMMLSGPQTHIVNMFSNAIVMVAHPTELLLGATIKRNKNMRRLSVEHLKALKEWDTISESFKAMGRVWKSGEAELDTLMRADEGVGEALEGLQKGGADGLVKALAYTLNLPSRALVSADEFFKQMTYRANVKAQAVLRHTEYGVTDPKELAEAVMDDLKAAFDADGGALHPQALEKAQYATFTNPLDGGFKKVQEFVNEHDKIGFVGRVIMPFVRTPINLARHAGQRVPLLGAFQKQMWADLHSGNKDLVAQAVGRQAMGIMAWSSAAALVGSGLITGSGPHQKGLRDQWLKAGNQPYSIKLPGGVQISYRRWEPYATHFALVADAVEAMGELSDEEAESLGGIIVALFASTAASFSSKSFLQGFVEAADVISSRDPDRVRIVRDNIGTSFVVPNLARQLNWDPQYREARGFVDELRSRLPGFSEQLEPRRNLLGEPVLKPPFSPAQKFIPTTVMGEPDPVLQQLAELGESITLPGKTLNGLDLTDRNKWWDQRAGKARKGQSPYDRTMEIVQQADLRGQLKTLMTSKAWAEAGKGNEHYPGGERLQLAKELIRQVHTQAREQAIAEYPSLQDAATQKTVEKAESLRSGTIAGDGALFK